MFKSATVILVLAGSLALTACGDPSESVPTQPNVDQPAQEIPEVDLEFKIVTPGGPATTKLQEPGRVTKKKPTTATKPKATK